MHTNESIASKRSAIDGRGPAPAANQAPLASVVIPTYNRCDYLAEAIQSVLNQTYRPIEIIVVDDGSTDNTKAVIEPFLPRLIYIWQENAERGAARNNGLRHSTGEYIAFLDSDDVWLPEMVESCVRTLEADKQYGLVYTDALQIDSHGEKLRTLKANGPTGPVTKALLRRNLVSIGRHLMRTSLAREIGGFKEERALSGSEDLEFWLRLSLRTEFVYLPAVTAKIRTHPANTMNDASAMQRSMAYVLQLLRNSNDFAAIPRSALTRFEADVALVNAINFCSARNGHQSLKFLWNAALTDPRVLFDLRYPYTIARLLKTWINL